MADEQEDLDLEDETPEGDPQAAPAAQRDDASYWRVRAEKAERKAKRMEAFTGLQAKYPGVSIDDLKGVDVTQWDRVASRFHSAASEPAAPAAPAAEPEAPAVPQEAVEAAKAFTQGAGGSGPVGTDKISFAEAKRLGGPANPQVRELLRKGLVEGATPPAQ